MELEELYNEGFTQNREISWLRFNERVLMEAADSSVPLFERLKFISIFSSNLDEFFMVRVGSLLDMMETDDDEIDNKSGLKPSEQLEVIHETVKPLYAVRDWLYRRIENKLRNRGIYCLRHDELTHDDKKFANEFFKSRIRPKLEPQVLSAGDPFPELKNNTDYAVGLIRGERENQCAIVQIPDVSEKFVVLPNKSGQEGQLRYILTEEIVLMNMRKIFLPFEVEGKAIMKMTRNADIKPDEESSDLRADFRDKMQALVNKRTVMAPDRLETDRRLPIELREFLLDKLELSAKQHFITRAPLSMGYVFALEDHLSDEMRKKLCYEPFEPYDQLEGIKSRVIDIAKRRDIFSSYPYDSMDPLLSLLKEAGEDDSVKEIHMTIYRLADKTSIIDYLGRAAKKGKKVKVVIELRARFDEQHNIDWSDRLEEAGCEIFYGNPDFKVHSKLLQLVFDGEDGDRYITQIGTGNYNEKTAKLYTDMSLITSDQKIGREAAKFFSDMTKNKLDGEYDRILAAPSELRDKVVDLIERETKKGRKGRIFFKINSITDALVIEKLAEASCAGVKVRMIVRGICCLLPGIPGATENIEIVNVVGRFLEHSRVYIFGDGDDEEMYIASSDMMTRNTVRRVELACPIYDENIRRRIKHTLYLNYMDNVKGRRLSSDGLYEKKRQRPGQQRIDSQRILMLESEEKQQRRAQRLKSESEDADIKSRSED